MATGIHFQQSEIQPACFKLNLSPLQSSTLIQKTYRPSFSAFSQLSDLNGNDFIVSMMYSNQYFFLSFNPDKSISLSNNSCSWNVDLRVDNFMFQNNIVFWGEIVQDVHGNFIFLIEDLVSDEPNYINRYEKCIEILNNHYNSDFSYEPFTLQLKKISDYAGARRFIKIFIPQINYDTRAVIFMHKTNGTRLYIPYYKTIAVSADSIQKYYNTVQKNKKEESIKVDNSKTYNFEFKHIAGDVIKLFLNGAYVSTLNVPTMELSHKIQEYISSHSTIKCKNVEGKWFAIDI